MRLKNIISTTPRTIDVITKADYSIFICDLNNANEDEVCKCLFDTHELSVGSKKPFAIIYNCKGIQATPKMRQYGKLVLNKIEESNKLIAACLYGQNSFVTQVAKIAYNKMEFCKNEDECIGLIEKKFRKKFN